MKLVSDQPRILQSRLGALAFGLSFLLVGLALIFSSAFTYLLVSQGFVVYAHTISTLSSFGLTVAWSIIALLGISGALLSLAGAWFLRGSFSSPRRRSRAARIAGLLVPVLALAFLVGSAFAQPAFAAVGSSQTAVLSQSSCSGGGTASYFIQTDGSYYYAFDSNACALAYGGPNNAGGAMGTNATTVTNDALSAVGLGGLVFLSASNFKIGGTLLVPSNVHLQGSGPSTVLLPTGKNHSVIEDSAGTVGGVCNADVSDLYVDGVGLTMSSNPDVGGILWYTGECRPSLTVNDVNINYLTGNGIDTYQVSASGFYGYTVIKNVNMYGNLGYGINLQTADNTLENVYVNDATSNEPSLYTATDGGMVVNGGYFGGSDGTAQVQLDGTGWATFTNTVIDSSGQIGLYVQVGAGNVSYTGGLITNCGISKNDVYSCVDIGSTNSVVFQGTQFWNNNANKPAYLVAITGTPAHPVQFINCIIQVDTFKGSGGMLNYRGGAKQANILMTSDPGFNPYGIVASPFDMTNDYITISSTGTKTSSPTSSKTYTVYQDDVRLIVTGGTVSAISIDGASTGLTSGVFILNVGETFSITYSVAPAVTAYFM